MAIKNVIAVSACLKRCSIAISYEGALHETNENVNAAADLVGLANDLIKSSHIDLQKIEGIITTSGPGSFTGIRVAQSFAKGLAMTLRTQAMCVSYFDVIRHMVISSGKSFPTDTERTVAVLIKSDEDNYMYGQTGCGVDFYGPIESFRIENETILAGDAVNDFCQKKPYLSNTKSKIFISDFRKASCLLPLFLRSSPGSQMRPLYLVKQQQYA
ncbi:MAG: hypothetical protein LBS14_00175 [Holosporaceae bacterium]|jgi:tRNA threonylcarbamoyl adenosine modification protein YeaZ|nr:hypothetical protein [Holosporaceae bacterium]